MSQESEWLPLTITEVSTLLKSASYPWWIAGGLAIDHFIGRKTREHGDIDILINRADQLKIQKTLAGWDLQAADPPGTLRPWKRDETLLPAVHVIWARPQVGPWRLEIMLLDTENEDWIYRRDPRIRGSLRDATQISTDGIQYLAPEIQLLYKSKSIREKDQSDFENCLPLLSSDQKSWLKKALSLTYQNQHSWLSKLDGKGT